MFPESHSSRFLHNRVSGGLAQAILSDRVLHVALMNSQPMGFYPMETLKQDARRFSVPFLNPSVNRSDEKCIPQHEAVLLGLRFIKDVGDAGADRPFSGKEQRGGAYTGAGDLVRRTGLKSQAVESLVMAGAFDSVTPLTEGRRYGRQDCTRVQAGTDRPCLPTSMDASMPRLPDFMDAEKMAAEYAVMGIYPRGHLMEFVRPTLAPGVMTCADVEHTGRRSALCWSPVGRWLETAPEGQRRHHIRDHRGRDRGRAGHPVASHLQAAHEGSLSSQVVLIAGEISRWDGTSNTIVSEVRALRSGVKMPEAHNWR